MFLISVIDSNIISLDRGFFKIIINASFDSTKVTIRKIYHKHHIWKGHEICHLGNSANCTTETDGTALQYKQQCPHKLFICLQILNHCMMAAGADEKCV